MSLENEYDVVILGAGLSGLSLAYFLRNSGMKMLLLEASDRIGGRIYTHRPSGKNSHIELGATWFGPKHQHLISLLEALGLAYFEQHQKGTALFQSMSFVKPQAFQMPDEASEPTFRIIGGTDRLINSLAYMLSLETQLLCNTRINATRFDQENSFEIIAENGQVFKTNQLVCTLPPAKAHVLLHKLTGIKQEQLQIMQKTHTWMHDSIKFALKADRPYWREEGFSGTFFSQVGPVVEMYDHSNKELDFFAVKGFLAGSVRSFTVAEREEMVRKQLQYCLPFYEEGSYEYFEYNWSENELVFDQFGKDLLPHQYNGHQLTREALIPEKLWLGGTETASQFPGYMDGAVERAKELAQILQS